MKSVLPAVAIMVLLAGCVTDAATRIAYDIEAAADRVGQHDGATRSVLHRTPSKAGECVGRYRVQFDQVGALIVWCTSADGTRTESSHSTSYHARFVDTPSTIIVDKGAGEPLVIDLERRGGRIVIVKVT